VPHRRIEAILAIVLVVFSVVGQFHQAHAAGTLGISPTRTQEGSPLGVTLVLTVKGVVGGQSYTDYWAVSDPSGKNYTITTTVVAPPSGNYTVIEVYPRDFGVGAGLTYVGQYSVAIFQTAPSLSLVGAGQFGIGITDRLFYERTQAVSIKAAGYNPNDMVTVSISKGGIAAPGFPIHVPADGTGNVVASWITTVSTLTGNYTVLLRGTGTSPKNPPDSQWFILIPATLDLTPVISSSASNLAISASVIQPDGTSFTRGNVTGQFSVSAMSIGGPIRLLYDPIQGKWTGSYPVQSSDPSGLWTLGVTALDSYGNNGQSSASLSVTPPPPPQPPPQNLLTNLWILALMAVIPVGALMGFFLQKRKKALPPHLQVDMEAVDVEASKVIGQGFFKSIQEQLVKDKAPVQGEKDG
jgi:hypothetical protein